MSTPKKTEPLQINFSLSIDGGKAFEHSETLQLENIPGAWRVHGAGGTKPGVGVNRTEAVINYLGKNYGSQSISDEDVCKNHLDTLLRRADSEKLRQATQQLMQCLSQQ